MHEITRGSIVEHYGTPAIVSTKRKHDPNLPTKHWWIIQPVADAIAVAKQLPSESELVFSPLVRRQNCVVVRGSAMLDTFIAHINAHHGDTGLEPIPPGRVRSHMFRRTMSMENAIIPPDHKGPLQDRCRPDRCGNSIIGPEHVPIWDAEKRALLTLLDTPKLPPCRKAALRRELTDVEAVLGKADKERP